jgi:hypothetical protein
MAARNKWRAGPPPHATQHPHSARIPQKHQAGQYMSVQNSAASRATRPSLTAIDRAFARRDFCDNALAVARTSANTDQSDAIMWDRNALLSGGTPLGRSSRCILPCARQQF